MRTRTKVWFGARMRNESIIKWNFMVLLRERSLCELQIRRFEEGLGGTFEWSCRPEEEERPESRPEALDDDTSALSLAH